MGHHVVSKSGWITMWSASQGASHGQQALQFEHVCERDAASRKYVSSSRFEPRIGEREIGQRCDHPRPRAVIGEIVVSHRCKSSVAAFTCLTASRAACVLNRKHLFAELHSVA